MTTTRRTGTVRKTAHDPGDPLVTSHCPFCGSGQVVGRSDGTIGCDFCGQSYIVRVQPAFPGMPQMPMGPGAPSDVGPDGGLVDPGMVGPDGMPMDGDGPPPGEDAESGGGPQDEPPGDGGDVPTSGGGSEDDDTGSGPPKKDSSGKKGKSKKESALRGIAVRRYNGLEGQPLTEDQLLRHVAIRVSGADPRVLAAMRRESARGRRPFRAVAVNDSRDHWDRAMRSLNESGFPDSQMELDTGHRLWFFHQGDVPHRATQMPPGFNVHVWHPNMTQHHGNTNLSAHLGNDPDRVGPLMRRLFVHPEATQHLMRQMQGDPGLGHAYVDMTQGR